MALGKSVPAEEFRESPREHNAADDHGCDASQEDRRGCNVQTGTNTRPGNLIEPPVDRFDGAIEKLCREYHANATEQDAPLQGLTTKHHAGRDDQNRKEEVNEKA